LSMVSFSFDDIELAYMFVIGGPAFENEAFLDTETGKIYYRSLMGGLDEFDEAGLNCEEMVAIP